jgi:hypothetical protein
MPRTKPFDQFMLALRNHNWSVVERLWAQLEPDLLARHTTPQQCFAAHSELWDTQLTTDSPDPAVWRWIQAHGGEPTPRQRYTWLTVALQENKLGLAQWCRDQGTPLSWPNEPPLLHHAIKQQHLAPGTQAATAGVTWWLAQGEPLPPALPGQDPLRLTLSFLGPQGTDVLKVLLAAGAEGTPMWPDQDSPDVPYLNRRRGGNALHHLARLVNNAPWRTPDQTAADYARAPQAFQAQWAALVAHGVDPDQPDAHGETPHQIIQATPVAAWVFTQAQRQRIVQAPVPRRSPQPHRG